ncbi:DUF1642 domain-containing protein [Streptococcus cameli]
MEFKKGQEVWVKGVVDYEGDIVGDVSEDFIFCIFKNEIPLVETRTDEKVKIPKFVAEWIDFCKDAGITLIGAIEPIGHFGEALAEGFDGDLKKSQIWLRRNQTEFARAWLDGYEVEREKLYMIKLPNGQGLCESESGALFFGNRIAGKELYAKKTKSEFEKAGYAWAWNEGFAKEVEE